MYVLYDIRSGSSGSVSPPPTTPNKQKLEFPIPSHDLQSFSINPLDPLTISDFHRGHHHQLTCKFSPTNPPPSHHDPSICDSTSPFDPLHSTTCFRGMDWLPSSWSFPPYFKHGPPIRFRSSWLMFLIIVVLLSLTRNTHAYTINHHRTVQYSGGKMVVHNGTSHSWDLLKIESNFKYSPPSIGQWDTMVAHINRRPPSTTTTLTTINNNHSSHPNGSDSEEPKSFQTTNSFIRVRRGLADESLAEIERFLKALLPKITSPSQSNASGMIGRRRVQSPRSSKNITKTTSYGAHSITRALLKQAALVIRSDEEKKGILDDGEDDYNLYDYDEDLFTDEEEYINSYDHLRSDFQKNSLGSLRMGEDSNMANHKNNKVSSHLSGNAAGPTFPKKYSKFHCRNSFIIQIATDGTVNGTKDQNSDNTLLQITNIGSHSALQIFGVMAKRYVCMDFSGNLYSTPTGKMKKECIFIKSPYGHHYFTLHSIVPHLIENKESLLTNKDRFYVGLNINGQPKPGFKSQKHSKSSHFFASHH